MNAWALPDQIRRARESIGVEVEQAAQLASVSSADLVGWETGLREPDDEELWRLSEVYGRPVSYFFTVSGEPPVRQDFRTERSIDPAEEWELRRTVVAHFEELCRSQQALERLVDEPDRPNLIAELLARVPPLVGGHELAALVRAELGLGQERIIKDMRALLEAAGVRVFVVSFPAAGLAGTCWWHPEFGPSVLLNRRDRESRRAFTAAHELAHLLRPGGQALCGFLGEGRNEERDANQFAASFLMPEGLIGAEADVLRQREELLGWDTPDRSLERVARHLYVSRDALSWRMEGLDLLPKGFTSVRRSVWERSTFYGAKRGAQWIHRVRDLGPRHVRLARTAYEDGKVSLSVLARTLQIDPEQAVELVAGTAQPAA